MKPLSDPVDSGVKYFMVCSINPHDRLARQFQWLAAEALTCGIVKRVGDGRRDHRGRRFTDAARRLRGIHNMHLNARHLIDTKHSVVVKIRLHHTVDAEGRVVVYRHFRDLGNEAVSEHPQQGGCGLRIDVESMGVAIDAEHVSCLNPSTRGLKYNKSGARHPAYISATVGRTEAAVELTGMYSQPVPKVYAG